MAHESQDATDDKMWPPHIKQIFIEIMLDEQLKGNMENGVLKMPIWESITKQLNTQTGKNFLSKKVIQKHTRLRQKQRKWAQLLNHIGLGWDEMTQTVTGSEEAWAHVLAGDPKAALLRKKGCPHYDKLRQLFAPNTATGALQISSNTPAPNNDEKRALEEELANEIHRTQIGHNDYYSPCLDRIPVEDSPFPDQTQRADKRPVQDTSGQGKKAANKGDKVSELTVALQEYTAMARERYSRRRGRVVGSSEQFGQSATVGDPCSLGKAIDVLNHHDDLDDDAYFAVSTALHLKENRVVFMGMPEHRRKNWMNIIAKRNRT